MASKVMGMYVKLSGKIYLQNVLQPILIQVMESLSDSKAKRQSNLEVSSINFCKISNAKVMK
jgi:hypothetical protein